MANEFTLPELGENITSADVLQVLIKPGDKVSVDQTIMEIETDKATIEVPSTISGIVKEVNVKAGDKAKIGQVIFSIEDAQGSPAKAAPKDGADSKMRAADQSQSLSPQAKEAIKDRSEEQKSTGSTRQGGPKAQAEVLPETEAKQGGLVEFKLPELGENIASADVLQVKVSPGDKIEKDQIIMEIETDKATIEVPSDTSGIVKDVLIKAGEKAKVGQVIITIEQSQGAGQQQQTQAQRAGAPETEKVDNTLQNKIESADKEEKVVSADQVPEIKPAAKPEGRRISEEPAARSARPKTYVEERAQTDPSKIAPAAPTVRRFAREIGVNINEVPGSGPGGRISIPDVKAYARELSKRQKQIEEAPRVGAGVPAEQLPDFSRWGEIERKDMSNVRRKTAEHLSYAWATVPHVTQFDKADITELENLRKTYGKRAEAEGGKLTVTAILLKVVASALKAFPQFNSSVDMQNNAVVYKKYYNIGVAVDTDRGLLVPVIRNVDKKNIIELSVELNKMAERARNKKLSIEDMQGGTFTITNLGGIGGTYFSPIVNSPEVAILGVSRSIYEPMYNDGEFKPRLMLPLSLSYDHRIIDGADGARFLRWIVDAIQQPFLMALEG